MGKDSPSPPAAPDYIGAANAQGAANVETARTQAKANNPNVTSPYGSQTVTWGKTPQQTFDEAAYLKANPDVAGYAGGAYQHYIDHGRAEGRAAPAGYDPNANPDQANIVQTLTPNAQATLDAQQGVQRDLAKLGQQGIGTAQNVLGTPFSFGGPGVQTGLDTSGVAKMPVNAGTTGYNAIMSRLEPQMGRQRTSLETQLTNQGLRPGTEAWTNAMTDLGNQENDQRTQAAATGVNLDMTANNQGFNQALQGGQFGNTAQQQALSQAIQGRQMPLNEITALMSGSQIQAPQFQNYQGSQIAPPQIANAVAQQGQYANNLYNQQVGQQNANTSGLFSLGGAGLGAAASYFSDSRLKSNIVRVGTHPLGIGIYEYDIFGHRERGVMAQELLGVKPSAVHRHASGYLMVDYGGL